MEYAFTVRAAAPGGSIPLESLEKSPDIACQLNPNLEIIYCNPAWDAFALSNGGELALSTRTVGTDIMRVVPIPLQPFYRAVYENARQSIVEFLFECSSADQHRRFQMQVLPNHSPGGSS